MVFNIIIKFKISIRIVICAYTTSEVVVLHVDTDAEDVLINECLEKTLKKKCDFL